MSTSLVDACQLRKTSTTPKSGNGESKVWGGKNKKKTVDKLSKLMSNASQDRLEFFSSALKVQTFFLHLFLVRDSVLMAFLHSNELGGGRNDYEKRFERIFALCI
jgi:hypothetical protein